MGSDRLKALYPMVDENETPLPRCWSTKDKFTSIGLSQGNLRVHYKGKGQTHKDAASVRATKPIPAACGLYYFEVKIINKGRDGYMGVGLSIQGVSMNRLPGWDKYSYGYHGDDGHSFCSSGSGQPYGPTFTTGDVVGCAVNLIDSTCYYTKNGINLGVAFTDLPKNLYPTVGLQTPGEVVDGNFGQSPFVYDIENDMRELRMRTVSTIDKYLIPDKYMHQSVMHKMVQSFLVHHGFSATAEAFARATGQEFVEDLISIRNRQRIQRLVLAGRVSEAIETTQNLYPGIFERDLNLLFRLKVRQFIEMVAGADAEVKGSRSPKSQFDSPSMSPSYGSTFSSHSSSSSANPAHIRRSRSRSNSPTVQSHTSVIQSTRFANGRTSVQPVAEVDGELDVQSARSFSNGLSTRVIAEDGDTDVDMEAQSSKLSSNGVHNGSSHNGAVISTELAMDVDGLAPIGRQLCGGSSTAIEKTLSFGRELKTLGDQMKEKYGKNEANKKMMSDAFSLIAYQDPWSSKAVGWQLDRSQREQLCDLLNSAIVETHRMPGRPPLELALAHGTELGNSMAQSDLGLCAFVSVKSILEAPDQCLFPSPKLNQKIDSLTRTLAKKGRNIADEES